MKHPSQHPSQLFVVYAPVEVIIFLRADIPQNRPGASLYRLLWLKLLDHARTLVMKEFRMVPLPV